MIALARIGQTALVGGQLALSLLSEAEPAEGPDCTGWKIALVAVAILAIFLGASVVWLLLRRGRLEIRLIATIALLYLSGQSISFVVSSLGVEFNVSGVGWSGTIVALGAIGVIGLLGWHRQSRAVSDPLAGQFETVLDGLCAGKSCEELADDLKVPKDRISTIYLYIAEIHRGLH